MSRTLLSAGDLAARLERLAHEAPGWSAAPDRTRLVARWTFPDFATALDFTCRLGALAEALGHHPELRLGWGSVEAAIWTHSAGGLTDLDFEFVRAAAALERESATP